MHRALHRRRGRASASTPAAAGWNPEMTADLIVKDLHVSVDGKENR